MPKNQTLHIAKTKKHLEKEVKESKLAAITDRRNKRKLTMEDINDKLDIVIDLLKNR